MDIVHLQEPIEVDGTTYTQIILDCNNKTGEELTGEDLMRATRFPILRIPITGDFKDWTFFTARLLNVPYLLLSSLPLPKLKTILNSVQSKMMEAINHGDY